MFIEEQPWGLRILKSAIRYNEMQNVSLKILREVAYLLTIFHDHVEFIQCFLTNSYVEHIDDIRMSEWSQDRDLPKRSDRNAIMPFRRENSHKL